MEGSGAKSIGELRALVGNSAHSSEINHTVKEYTYSSDRRGLEGIIASFDFSGPQLITTISTLNLFLLEHCDDRFGKTIKDDLVVILDRVALMLRSNTKLKHVRVSYGWHGHQWVTGDDGEWFNRAQVEARTQARLQLMICLELRFNTKLESLEVEATSAVETKWTKLSRVGTEWQMRHGDQLCLEQDSSSIVNESSPPCQTQTCRRLVGEYVVEVKIIHHSHRLRDIAQRLMCFRSDDLAFRDGESERHHGVAGHMAEEEGVQLAGRDSPSEADAMTIPTKPNETDSLSVGHAALLQRVRPIPLRRIR